MPAMLSRRKETGPSRGAVMSVRAALLLALFLAGSFRLAHAEQEPVSKEYQIKAAFLYNFTKFVEWSPERFAGPAEPIVIGVLGENPFGDELENIVRTRKVNGRSIVVAHFATVSSATGAHILYVSARDAGLAAELAGAAPNGVLTVSEAGGAAATVTFTTVGDKVRFEIDIAAAERAGLKVSAQLQKLALAVHRQRP
jgi:hypothetical protein